ncbi:uncharacterized protein DNG_02567 [Cephalotrichum gorgonifer]|uniref:Uncharacterized protein n=1 Tax=Cephalotrichum gorgonifer TaxID=2041049 RepID=A0AAE8MUN2_9PEZI|nr:uncharacterized protein DNG_02567 [Cephalotrichum gorgonifer]
MAGDAMILVDTPTTPTSTAAKLTVIITTSITPSAPSTELLSAILESFGIHCNELLGCNVTVVFDSYDKVVPRAQLKKGRVTAEQARDFSLYKENVKKLILEHYYGGEEATFSQTDAEAEYGCPFHEYSVPYTIMQSHDKKVTFIEPSIRLGFGLAVRSALRIIDTPYVWVQQHDWALVSDFPIRPLLKVMEDSETGPVPVKYVCLPAVRMLSYDESPFVQYYPALRALTSSLKRDFSPDPVAAPGDEKIPLTPLFFWHDKPHVASTAHYLSRIFPSRIAMLRGDFIEDKIGQRARDQMKEGHWEKWATWLYCPGGGKQVCLKHLHGRTFRGADEEAKRAAMHRKRNLEKREEVETSDVSESVSEDN